MKLQLHPSDWGHDNELPEQGGRRFAWSWPATWKPPFASQTERRFAFLLANSRYTNLSPLGNPGHDIARIAGHLRSIGFDVTSHCDLGYTSTIEYLGAFLRKAGPCDAIVLYYSGHGVQLDGDNYIVPVDFDPTKPVSRGAEADILVDLVRVQDIIVQMRQAKKRLIFLDACRDEGGLKHLRVRDDPNAARAVAEAMPSIATRSLAPGLAKLQLKNFKQTMICYAADPGDVARDGAEGSMSPFSSSVAEHVCTRGLDVFALCQRIARDVRHKTNGEQQPWSNSNLTEPFAFHPADKTPIWVMGGLGALCGLISAFIHFDLVKWAWPLAQGSLQVRDARYERWVLFGPLLFGSVLGLGAYLWGQRRWYVAVGTTVIYAIVAALCRLWFSFYVNAETIKDLGNLSRKIITEHPGLLLCGVAASGVAGAASIIAAAPYVRDMGKLPRISAGAIIGAGAVVLLLIFLSCRQYGLTGSAWIETGLVVALFMVWEAGLGINAGTAYAKPSNE